MGDRDDVIEYISRKGWEIQKRESGRRGKQIVLAVCPLCGKTRKNRSDRNFYICEETGQWTTFCCDKKGNLITLKRELGDLDFMTPGSFGTAESMRFASGIRAARGSTWAGFDLPPAGSAAHYHSRLVGGEVPGALEYLRGARKLTDATLEKFQLGVARRGYCASCERQTSLRIDNGSSFCPWCDGAVDSFRELVAIPYVSDGRVVNFKFRSFDGEKRLEKWTGAPTTLFNEESLGGEYKRAVLLEGELDAITLDQVGVACAVATGGAGKQLEDEWIEKLAVFDDVLLGQDADEAGDKGAEKCAASIGKYRCRRIAWPHKDANDCLQSGMTADEIRGVVDAAAGYGVDIVKPFSDFANELRGVKSMGDEILGTQTRWIDINRLIGGFRNGEMTVVTGETSSGKTTWVTNIAWDMSRGDPSSARAPVGVLVASFESRTRDVARKFVHLEANDAFTKLSDDRFNSVVADLSSRHLFFVDQYGNIPLADLRDAIEYGVRRYGLWLVVLDHLHFFMEPSDDERKQIDSTVRELKKWCVRLGIHMLLVVHPSKLRTIKGVEQKVELNDLKGSSAIKQDADNVVRVYRERDQDRKDGRKPAEIATLKVRSDLGYEGVALLDFDRRSLRYNDWVSDDSNRDQKSGQSTKRKKKKPPQAEMSFQDGDDDDDEPKQRRIVQGGREADDGMAPF